MQAKTAGGAILCVFSVTMQDKRHDVLKICAPEKDNKGIYI